MAGAPTGTAGPTNINENSQIYNAFPKPALDRALTSPGLARFGRAA